MKIFSTIILAGLAGFGLAGCAGNATNTSGSNVNVKSNVNAVNSNQAVVINSNANVMNSNTANSMSSTGNSTDFMNEAAQGGMAEVELGKLAATKAQDAEVKKFGQQMVTDHTKANDELKTLASKKDVKLPTNVTAEQKADADKLSKLSGKEFDAEYVKMMVEDHEKDVKSFQSEADGGKDAEVKAFAAKTLPTLKTHLEMIKSIQSKMK